MKNVTKILFVVSVSIFTFSSLAFAETPEEVVIEMMDKIRSAGSPAPFVEYVNWEAAYESLSKEKRAKMKVSSVKELRETFEGMFKDTKEFFKAKYEKRLDSIPKEKRPEFEASLEKRLAQIDAQQLKMKQQIQQTEYSIADTKIDGDTAVVKLVQKFDGKTNERSIKLAKTAKGRWLLDSAAIFSAQQPAGVSGKEAEVESRLPSDEPEIIPQEKNAEEILGATE